MTTIMLRAPPKRQLRWAMLALLVGATIGVGGASAQQPTAPATPAQRALPVEPITAAKIAADLWMVSGGTGSNVVVLETSQGLVLVDTKYEDQYPGLLKVIRERISNKPILYVINTHFHNDHSGANIAFRRDGAEVISATRGRENIQNGIQPGATNMVPANITISGEMRLFFDEKEVRIRHHPAAHSGSDVTVFFPQQRVMAVGDLAKFFPGEFAALIPPGPIDYNAGGGINSYIDVLQAIVDAEGYDQVVPGHGTLGAKADVSAYQKKLVVVRDRVSAFLRVGNKTEADLREFLANELKWPELFIARGVRGLYWDLKP